MLMCPIGGEGGGEEEVEEGKDEEEKVTGLLPQKEEGRSGEDKEGRGDNNQH